jgi:hypothetical protein
MDALIPFGQFNVASEAVIGSIFSCGRERVATMPLDHDKPELDT